MRNKIQAVTAILVTLASTVLAQENDSTYANKIVQKSPNRFEYYFNGGFGFYFPSKSVNVLSSRGVINTFQFQINYKGNFFSRFAFDLYNVNYTNHLTANGTNSTFQGKVQTTFIGLDLGYTGGISKKLTWFSYGGIGVVTMDVPLGDYSATTNTLRITTSTRNFMSYRGGAGFECEFNKFFIVYADIQFLSIPFKTDLRNHQLNGYSLQIGFKTPLQ
jgi:hypothetical protein